MNAPAVSVLLTTYNRESFLAPAIESVLCQTYENFELVIVDDGSTDRTVEIARSYERLDSRVRVLVNERNLGQFRNRNRAAELARAPLLKYHDSDDLMYPHCLSVMVPMLLSEPRAGFGLSSGSRWSGGPCPMLLTPRMAYQREFFGEGLFFCGPAGAIFRAEVFRELGGFPEEGVASDHLFWMRACKTISVLLMPADLFRYRLHPAQEFQSAKGRQEYARVPGLVWRALQAPDCPLTSDEREQARRNRAYHTARRTLEDLRRGRWEFAWNRLRYSNMGPADWLRYLRRPRRDAFAGTPLGPDGEFIIPGWAQPDRRVADNA
jgi:glycosyltransferase involved in cell wall biosynthesis